MFGKYIPEVPFISFVNFSYVYKLSRCLLWQNFLQKGTEMMLYKDLIEKKNSLCYWVSIYNKNVSVMMAGQHTMSTDVAKFMTKAFRE